MKTSCFAVALLLAACGGSQKPADTPSSTDASTSSEPSEHAHDHSSPAPEVDSAEAQRLVIEDGALLIDVRTAEEYDARHIKGAKRIGVDEVAERAAEIEEMAGGKDKPIVVYCGAGRRASRAQQALEDAGFSAVTNLGGVNDWACETDDCHEGSDPAPDAE